MPRKTVVLMPTVFFLLLSAALPIPAARAQETKAPPAAPVAPVTFTFYNLMNYLAMERRDGDEVVPNAPKPEREVTAVIEALTTIRPDILGVCELGDETFLADLQSRLKASGIDLPHTELVRDSAGWNRNLGLLSRFPIVARNSREDYTYELEGTKHSFQRGILDATIAVSQTYHLRYIGLHLKSKREVPEGDESLMRLNEARLARQHLDRILEAEPGANVIVSGDLNALRHEIPIKTLQGKFGQQGYLSALTLSDPYGFHWTHYWSFADEYSRFDYALYSQGLKDEIDREASHIHHWENWNKASDHRPLVIRIVPEDR